MSGHQLMVHSAWPSGRFIACRTCADQSRGSSSEDDLTAWAYEHLGRSTGLPIEPSMPRTGHWNVIPEGALF